MQTLKDKPMSDFLDFRLVVSKISANSEKFVAFVADSPVDRTYASFEELLNINEYFNDIFHFSVKCESGSNFRIVQADDENQLTEDDWAEISESLFSFLFPEKSKIYDLFLRSCERANNKGKYLRLRLELHPSLSDLPWEIMRCPTQYERAADILKAKQSIIRYLGDMHLEESTLRKVPSIIIIKANKEYDESQIIESFTLEVDRIVNILKPLPVKYRIIQRTNTLRELKEVIRELENAGNPVIGLHFIGHGGIDKKGSFFIGNKSENMAEQKLYVHQINHALETANSIRWVIINACYAGSEPAGNPLAGFATSISIIKNVPTVIAYKRAVHTKDAETLAVTFFENVLANGKPIETVLREMKNTVGLVILQRSIGGAIQETIDLGAYSHEPLIQAKNDYTGINNEVGDSKYHGVTNPVEVVKQDEAGSLEKLGTMIYVPAGQFRKGLSKDQVNSLVKQFKKQGLPIDEQSIIDVLLNEKESIITLSNFSIDIFPVTNEQFSKYIQDTHILTEAEIDGSADNWRKYAGPGKEIHPVVCVSKNDALAYCLWAEKRLPTSDEWVKAYRGKNGHIYPWGDNFDINKCNTAESMQGWETTPVNKFPKGVSEYGCYDMVGNVEELTDSSDDDGNVIILGGSWSMTCQVYGLPVLRRLAAPNFYSNDLGFRCAK